MDRAHDSEPVSARWPAIAIAASAAVVGAWALHRSLDAPSTGWWIVAVVALLVAVRAAAEVIWPRAAGHTHQPRVAVAAATVIALLATGAMLVQANRASDGDLLAAFDGGVFTAWTGPHGPVVQSGLSLVILDPAGREQQRVEDPGGSLVATDTTGSTFVVQPDGRPGTASLAAHRLDRDGITELWSGDVLHPETGVTLDRLSVVAIAEDGRTAVHGCDALTDDPTEPGCVIVGLDSDGTPRWHRDTDRASLPTATVARGLPVRSLPDQVLILERSGADTPGQAVWIDLATGESRIVTEGQNIRHGHDFAVVARVVGPDCALDLIRDGEIEWSTPIPCDDSVRLTHIDVTGDTVVLGHIDHDLDDDDDGRWTFLVVDLADRTTGEVTASRFLAAGGTILDLDGDRWLVRDLDGEPVGGSGIGDERWGRAHAGPDAYFLQREVSPRNPFEDRDRVEVVAIDATDGEVCARATVPSGRLIQDARLIPLAGCTLLVESNAQVYVVTP